MHSEQAASCQQLFGITVFVYNVTFRLAGARGRRSHGHVQCFFCMQWSGLAVRAEPAVVVNALGRVGILLDLREQDPAADSVQRTRFDKEKVTFMHLDVVYDL